ncbi:MAG: serine protease [Nitrospirales bacterium]
MKKLTLWVIFICFLSSCNSHRFTVPENPAERSIYQSRQPGSKESNPNETEKATEPIKFKDRADAIDKFLTNRELASIEGVWVTEDSEYEVAIIKNVIIKNKREYQSGRDFVGVITHSQGFTWVPGQIKLFLNETATPKIYSGNWFGADHRARGALFLFSSNNIIEFSLGRRKHLLVRTYPKELPSQPTGNKQTSSGTGFFVTPDLVATNFHVVQEANQISLSVEGVQIQADVFLKDAQNDLALLRLNPSEQSPVKESPKGVKCLSLGDSENARTGDAVLTVGFPLSGLLASTPSVGQGVISNTFGMANDPRMFQISIPIQPGNSGSPLLDEYGRVIGVVTSTLNSQEMFKTTGSIPQNVNFAIKSSYLKSIFSMVPSGDCSNSLAPQQQLTAREILDHYSKNVVPISVSR